VFDVDELINQLAATASESDPRRAAKEVIDRAMREPTAIADAIAPTLGGIEVLYHDAALTVINVGWAPGMQIMPHDHRMWAIIGIYAGIEDNRFYRRGSNNELVETRGRRLATGEAFSLGADTIHSVSNPASRLTAAVHVYGGDFLNEPRSQWGPGDLIERPYDMNDVTRQFHEANVAAGLTS
jgi:predicted metal-dependent enzyme (double-stranded beta helix superfamily)